MPKVRVEVTREDIKRGDAMDFASCPIALAARRIWPGSRVLVAGTNIRVIEGTSNRWFPLPRRAQTFIANFDEERRVHAFAFDLEVPA